MSSAADWLATERFDAVARSGADAPLPERLQMVRALLADRFGLRMHAETREQPVYVLDVISRDGKVGSGLKPSSCMPGTAPQPSATQTCGNRSAPGVIASGGATPDSLANQLGRLPAVARPVVNRTCVARIFDCELTFTADPAASATDTVSIFTALREQLGLRLEASRAPVEVLVIDAVTVPTTD